MTSTENRKIYLQGFNAGVSHGAAKIKKLEGELKEIKRLVDCKHLRKHSVRTENGYQYDCLTCGYEWFELDDPMSEDDKFDKAQFKAWQHHEKYLKDSGYKK